MTDPAKFRPALPEGWYYPDKEKANSLLMELQRELPTGHLLFDKAVITFAYREATDDVLFRHLEQPARFTIIHLSWLGKTEINTLFPAVELDGTFQEFLAEEERLFGLKPKKE